MGAKAEMEQAKQVKENVKLDSLTSQLENAKLEEQKEIEKEEQPNSKVSSKYNRLVAEEYVDLSSNTKNTSSTTTTTNIVSNEDYDESRFMHDDGWSEQLGGVGDEVEDIDELLKGKGKKKL